MKWPPVNPGRFITSTPDGTTLVVKYIIEPEQATELKDGGTPMLCGDW